MAGLEAGGLGASPQVWREPHAVHFVVCVLGFIHTRPPPQAPADPSTHSPGSAERSMLPFLPAFTRGSS